MSQGTTNKSTDCSLCIKINDQKSAKLTKALLETAILWLQLSV